MSTPASSAACSRFYGAQHADRAPLRTAPAQRAKAMELCTRDVITIEPEMTVAEAASQVQGLACAVHAAQRREI